MPSLRLPPEIAPIIREFLPGQKKYLATAEGKDVLKSLAGTTRRLFPPGGSPSAVLRPDEALAVTRWFGRLPAQLVNHPVAPLIDFRDLPKSQAAATFRRSLQTLAAGAAALLSGGGEREFDVRRILRAAFGNDPASESIRKPFDAPEFPMPPFPPKGRMPDIDALLLQGALADLMEEFAKCGFAAAENLAWSGRIQPIGRITALEPPRGCAGDTVRVTYEGFGAAPPPDTAEVILSYRTVSGECRQVTAISVARPLEPESILAEIFTWQDAGVFDFKLPADIDAGCIGFFVVPTKDGISALCGPGKLGGAAGSFQSILGAQFGGAGVQLGQRIVDVAGKIELGTIRLTVDRPCAECQPDNKNRLSAGPPRNAWIKVEEAGPVHPRGYVTLSWRVDNAEQADIVLRDVSNSENPHELRLPAGPIGSGGRQRIDVPCTRRWEGQFVLQASNANGCTQGPLEASVTVRSGFSHYKVGVSKVDITDARPDLGMAGFAYKKQTTSRTRPPPHPPLFARAFVIEENKLGNPQALIIVVADIWICSIAIKKAVVEKLQRNPQGIRFTTENIIIAATHTHGGAGGYSDYLLYNLMIGGFDRSVFDRIVDGIVYAIVGAASGRVAGRIYSTSGDLKGCGANRSIDAHKKNQEHTGGLQKSLYTDPQMTLLKFVLDTDNLGNTRPIGAVCWFAMHPTSLGMYNRRISGDNKGWAEKLFEDAMGGNDFVAAFANANAGDVSGNVVLDDNDRTTATIPLGGEGNPRADGQDDSADIAQLERIGAQQADHARLLFSQAGSELTGPLGARHAFVDMSNVTITSGEGSGEKTWPAALGISFGSGSSEDSIAFATDNGVDLDAGIIEGMTVAKMVWGGIAIFGAIAALTIVNPPAGLLLGFVLATGAASFATAANPNFLQSVYSALTFILLLEARSFLGGVIASWLFPGEIKKQTPVAPDGTWKWDIPAPPAIPADYAAGHDPKPIMFAIGLAKLKFTPNPGSTKPSVTKDCPLVPHVIPLQLMKIGDFAIAGVPAEFTAMAGRRLKDDLCRTLGIAREKLAFSGYSNGYSGYVTTREEYDEQHYEGASTLYGPHTLQAYRQCFETLATCLRDDLQMPAIAPPFEPGPFSLPAVYVKP